MGEFDPRLQLDFALNATCLLGTSLQESPHSLSLEKFSVITPPTSPHFSFQQICIPPCCTACKTLGQDQGQTESKLLYKRLDKMTTTHTCCLREVKRSHEWASSAVGHHQLALQFVAWQRIRFVYHVGVTRQTQSADAPWAETGVTRQFAQAYAPLQTVGKLQLPLQTHTS